MSVSDYNLETVSEIPHRVYFNLNGIYVSLANALRRSMMSIIPTVSFDDTWYEEIPARSIYIKSNTSALHNEWFAHRLSLIPLNMYKTTNLKVKTEWKTDHREYSFLEPDKLPIFSLTFKNNHLAIPRRNKEGHVEITTDDIIIENKDLFPELSIDSFIPHDLFTNDPIVLNLLKFNPLKEEEGEEIDVILKPVIGLGKYNSRNDPTSTVSYSFTVDTDREIEKNFQQFLAYQNKERIEKGLSNYTDDEVIKIRNSFDRLDKYRVYKKTPDGGPAQIQLSVEGNGFILPHQIVYDGILILQLLIKDLLNCIHLEIKDENLIIKTETEKLEFLESVSERMGYDFHINFENHTIGNIIADYLRRYFVNSDEFGLENKLLKMSAYTQPHPLKEKVVISSVSETNEKNKPILENILSKLLKVPFETIKPFVDKFDETETHKFIILSCFIRACNHIIKDLNNLKTNWSSVSGITETSYHIQDLENLEYIEHLNLRHKLLEVEDESEINVTISK